jgi:hypothetical protein
VPGSAPAPALRQAAPVTTTEDENRWSEAQSILDRTPTESAEQRIARWRRLTMLLVVGFVLVSVALAVAVAAWFGDDVSGRGSDDGPLWRTVTGLVVTLAATVLCVVGVVTQWRANRRRAAWRSPLVALSRTQRKVLTDQVRGRAPVDPAHLPLARHLAETLASQRSVVVTNLALLLLFTGQLITSPSAWRWGTVIVFGLVSLAFLPLILRNERAARRFLAEHPAAEEDSSAA